MDWIWTLLHNTAADRWHPLLFRPAPFPGPAGRGPLRYKSKGHHTEGFATRDEALDYIDQKKAGELRGRLCVDKAFEWDGQGLPTFVCVFAEQPDGSLIPI